MSQLHETAETSPLCTALIPRETHVLTSLTVPWLCIDFEGTEYGVKGMWFICRSKFLRLLDENRPPSSSEEQKDRRSMPVLYALHLWASEDAEMGWVVCEPQTVGGSSRCGYDHMRWKLLLICQ